MMNTFNHNERLAAFLELPNKQKLILLVPDLRFYCDAKEYVYFVKTYSCSHYCHIDSPQAISRSFNDVTIIGYLEEAMKLVGGKRKSFQYNSFIKLDHKIIHRISHTKTNLNKEQQRR